MRYRIPGGIILSRYTQTIHIMDHGALCQEEEKKGGGYFNRSVLRSQFERLNLKDLSLCHKLKFANSCIFEAQGRWPQIFPTINSFLILYQFLETGTSDRTLMGLDQLLKCLGFNLYPFSFFFYNPLNVAFIVAFRTVFPVLVSISIVSR